jgi:hypothetical protein
MFQLFVEISTQTYELSGKLTVIILSTGFLALTKPRMAVAHLWSQPREVKQYATIFPVSLGPNRSLLNNTMYKVKPCCHNILYVVTVKAKTMWKFWNFTRERKNIGYLVTGNL